MNFVLAEHDKSEDFYVLNFGYEDVSENAHWNKGLRNIYFIHYVVSGEGFFNSSPVKTGEGFFIKRGERSEYHSSKNNPWRYFWIGFGGDAAENIAKKYARPNENGVFEFNLGAEFLSLVDNLISEGSPLSVGKALGYFYFFMSHSGKNVRGYENRYVEDAKKYMSLNSSRAITVTELASVVGINDRYLYNLFIKHEGVSPKKYLSALKLSKAELMLKSTRLTISEIAEHCGFSDVLAFSKFFSKSKGISATKYRNLQLRNN